MSAPQSVNPGVFMWQEITDSRQGHRRDDKARGDLIASVGAKHRAPTWWTVHRPTIYSAACAVGAMSLWLVAR